MEATLSLNPAGAEAHDESELIRCAVDGDRDAFAILYRRHACWLLPLMWRMTGGDHGVAEDLTQEAFVQAWFKLGQLNDRHRFAGWLKALAINLVLADRRKLRPAGNDQALAGQESPQPPWPAADLDLETAIARLPRRARQVLVLFCIEGFSHEEIATAMKVEVGTSKAQLHRARALLKETLS